MPDVPLFNGNISLTYHTNLHNGDVFSAEIDNGYVGARYSLNFLLPYQSTGEYLKLASYDLTNIRIGLDSHNGWSVGCSLPICLTSKRRWRTCFRKQSLLQRSAES